jgi:transposase
MSDMITAERNQMMFMPPSINEWLPEDHLAVFIGEIVDRLDLTALEDQYRGSGKTAFSPALLLGLLFYGYSTGVFSSRKIEKATYDSVAFRYLSGNTHPDHDTIAAFRKRFLNELKQLFTQILLLAREMGFAKIGTVAIDGTKMRANASKHKAMSWGYAQRLEKQMRREIEALMRKGEQADATEDQEAIDIPEEIRLREKRLAKIEEAKRAIEDRARQRHEEAVKLHEERLRRRQETKERTGRGVGGKPSQPPVDKGPEDTDQHNFTDADSRIMKSKGGFEQCYNGQVAVDVEDMLVVGTSLTNSSDDARSLIPTLYEVAERTEDVPGSVIADAGYFSEANVVACESKNIEAYIALGREKHNVPLRKRPKGKQGTPRLVSAVSKMMWKRLRSEVGKEIYKVRKSTVEPVFGIIKEVMGFRRFLLRGITNVSGEWELVCLSYNLKRMHQLALG